MNGMHDMGGIHGFGPGTVTCTIGAHAVDSGARRARPRTGRLVLMQSDFTPAEIAVMATRAGLVVPEEDLASVAKALSAHFKRVEPLMALELSSVEPAVLFDPRWHD